MAIRDVIETVEVAGSVVRSVVRERKRRATSAGAGGWISVFATRGGLASAAGFRTSQPHFTPWARARRRTTCARRTVAGANGRPSFPPAFRSRR
jgi:hypothetical protein